MQNLVVVDIKERFCSISVFSGGWSAGNLKANEIINGIFLETAGDTASKVNERIRGLSPGAATIILLLPRSLAQIVSLELPAQNSEQLRKMMEFEVTRHFPISKNQLAWDYFVADNIGGQLGVNLAGLKRSDYDRFLTIANDAGIMPETVSISSAGWLLPPGETDVPAKRALIEIIPEGFELNILDGNRVLYSRLKRFKPEIDDSSFFASPFRNETELNLITDHISDELNHIKLVSNINGLSEYLKDVYLVGGGSLRAGVARKLSLIKNFASSNIYKLPKEDNEKGFDYVSTTTGMAGISSTDVRFNFIPPQNRFSFIGAAKRRVVLSFMAVLILLSVWALTFWGTQVKVLNKLETELVALKSEASKTEKALIKVEEMQKYFSTFKEYGEGKTFSLRLLDALTVSLPVNTYLAEIDFRSNEILISGTSTQAVSLLNILENLEMFSNVRMVGPVKTVRGTEKFKIGMELE